MNRWLRQRLPAILGALMMATEAAAQGQSGDEFESQRRRMLEEIAAMARDARFDTGRTTLSAPVIAAIGRVPRHEFVPLAARRDAYANRPLSIGAGQTISQPFIVALMSDLLELKPGDKVLEVGTGSGYQAAVLAELGAQVHTIEIIGSLARDAQLLLQRLGYRNIVTRLGDGYKGWPEAAPFDAIMLTAAPRDVPPPLIEQLKPGGRLIAPLGERDGVQSLQVLTKGKDGRVTSRKVLAVRFVPLTDVKGRQQ